MKKKRKEKGKEKIEIWWNYKLLNNWDQNQHNIQNMLLKNGEPSKFLKINKTAEESREMENKLDLDNFIYL